MVIGDALHFIVITYICEQVRKHTHDTNIFMLPLPSVLTISSTLTLAGKNVLDL
jgi:hypothetical protein